MLTAAVVGTMLPCTAMASGMPGDTEYSYIAHGMAGYTERQEIKGDISEQEKSGDLQSCTISGDCVLGNGQSGPCITENEKNRSVSPAASTGIATDNRVQKEPEVSSAGTQAQIAKKETAYAGQTLTVGGINAFETLTGEGWSFQPGTNTLTLNGYAGGAIHAEGFSLTVALAEGSANVITSDISQNGSALGANTFGYSDDSLTLRGEGAGASLLIDGDLQGIYAQGGVAVQNCNLTVGIRSTEASEEKVSDGTMSSFTFGCIRAGGGLLIEDSNIDLSSQKGTENNKKTYAGIGAATGRVDIRNCSITIDAASTGIQSSNKPLNIENCTLDIRGDETAAIVCQWSTVALTGCKGTVASGGAQGVGITAQRAKGSITLTDCQLSLDSAYYGIMALADSVYLNSSTLDFPAKTRYGIYAADKIEASNGSAVNGQNCTFVCYMPAESGCTIDEGSAVNGVQLFNGKKNVTVLGTFTFLKEYMAAVGDVMEGKLFTVDEGAEATVAEDAVLDITEAASVSIEGKLINHGIWRLNGEKAVNTGTIVNWRSVEETADTAIRNNGAAYSVCTALFPVQGNAVIPMHKESQAVEENRIEPTCTSEGSYDSVVYCANCGEELSRVQKILAVSGHSYSQEWKNDAESHWHECSVCGEQASKAAHNFAWVTDREASVQAPGLQHETCTVCGYSKAAAEIPAPNDGTDTAASDAEAPKTGDSSSIVFWTVSAVLMGVGSVGGTVLKRRKNKNSRMT
ncbi:LPXTG-motif protein cell wall anchor domain protein [Christensenella minuta]|uniref:LPXTG-motif protein cell wall anchor domain protein n=2 Tax=Christensenella minuta TaxID=626937 RepID=A0A136Q2H8_9FIRM|nr:LPXTG-motif protein cell wall anchor domain protein [Christensenella minuta]